jgi:hypothetical protein
MGLWGIRSSIDRYWVDDLGDNYIDIRSHIMDADILGLCRPLSVFKRSR